MNSPNPTPPAALDEGLVRYLAARDRQRYDRINRALATLRPFERRLVMEAAVMGYVRGVMRGRVFAGRVASDREIPPDADILAEVVGCCIDMGDMYPYLGAAADGRRRRVTRARSWPGELPASPQPVEETPR